MEKQGWKITAIIFMVLFFSFFSLTMWGLVITEQEASLERHCFYNVCGEYPDAYYMNKVCTCYDYGVLGDLVEVKTEVVE